MLGPTSNLTHDPSDITCADLQPGYGSLPLLLITLQRRRVAGHNPHYFDGQKISVSFTAISRLLSLIQFVMTTVLKSSEQI